MIARASAVSVESVESVEIKGVVVGPVSPAAFIGSAPEPVREPLLEVVVSLASVEAPVVLPLPKKLSINRSNIPSSVRCDLSPALFVFPDELLALPLVLEVFSLEVLLLSSLVTSGLAPVGALPPAPDGSADGSGGSSFR